MATNFSTYGMVGVGIAAAIGFVFALSFFGGNNSNNNGGGVIDDGQLLQKQSAPGEEQQRAASAPTTSDEQGPGGEAALFAKDNNESGDAAGSAPAEESANSSSSMMQAADIRPDLVSIVELDANREVEGDVLPGTEFKAGEPVIIRATFANNNNDAIVHDHLISMSIRPADNGSESISDESGPFEHAASFHGDIGSNSAVDLELYWVPQQAGDYTLLVFSATPGDLNSTVPVAPVAGIPIRVSD